MCLYYKKGEQPKVALENKKCYKVLVRCKDGKLKAPLYKFSYEIGKVYEEATNTELTTCSYSNLVHFDFYSKMNKGCFVDSNGDKWITKKYDNDYVYDNNGNMILTYSIGQGFHTCKSIDACLKIVNPHFAENLVIAECIIPRGSFYYTGRANRFTNDDYYASNALKIEKIIVDLGTKNYVLPLQ